MRGLKTAVIVMGVLIVAGVGVIIVTLVSRVAVPQGALADMLLDEPAGTHIAAAAGPPDKLVVLLQGGGPDRVVVLDLGRSRRIGGVALAH